METYYERFINDIIEFEKTKGKYEADIKKYEQLINILNKDDIHEVIDEALKDNILSIIRIFNHSRAKTETILQTEIENLNFDIIINYIKNKIEHIYHYNINSIKITKEYLFQIKELGLLKYYYDLIDVESKLDKTVIPVVCTPFDLFKSLIDAYKNTDYLDQIKKLMDEYGELFYNRLLKGEVVIVKNLSTEILGTNIFFRTKNNFKIIKDSIRLTDSTDIKSVDINNHSIGIENITDINDYIVEGNNMIKLNINNLPNKIPRSIVYLAKRIES